MSSLLKILKKGPKKEPSTNKNKGILPQESPLTPAIFNIIIKLKIEGRIGTSLITDYLSVIILALSHDILIEKPDFMPVIPYLWTGILNMLMGGTIIHQLSDEVTEMVTSNLSINAFSEGSIIPVNALPYSAVGTRTWELQSSDNSLLVTVLTYDINIRPGAHHMRSHLRSTGHCLFPFPIQKFQKQFRDLQKWYSGGDKTHSQAMEYLLLKHLNHKASTLTTIVDHHEEIEPPHQQVIAIPSAPPSYGQ